ncbi:Gfo/Idh/MocA family oxidoreductase [Candidatus Dependentiae bacterium]|nr:Gfo/Idh/MocA family oxidoreductase [Candidatus Dependentiae bacterium]
MIKLGIIGLGRMGTYHASVCTMLPSIKLVGIADLNQDNLAKIKSTDIVRTTDYRELLPLVDAVIIALPTDLHYEVAKDALKMGVHVLIEKPLTRTIAQAEELFELAIQKNLTLHVGHVERFNGALQELKKIIQTPFLIEMQRVGPFNARVAADSVVLDLMIHDLDLVLNLVPSKLAYFHASGRKIHSENCDIASVQLGFENGTLATIFSSRASQIKNRSMAIHQAQEYIHLNFTTQDLAIHRGTSSSIQVGQDQLRYKQEALIEHLFVYKDNPLKLEIEHFINTIKSGSQHNQPIEDTAALRLTFAIEERLGLR